MATTRDTLKTELGLRLGDAAHAVWASAEKDGFLNYGITSAYPYWFNREVETTIAADGPIQSAPDGARNLYEIGLQRDGSPRVRTLRGWKEGNGEAIVPKTGIAGDTLVWCWTAGWDIPSSGSEVINLPVEAEEYVLIRANISALEKLLTKRLGTGGYQAIQVRQIISEDEIANSIDALHSSLKEHLERAMTLPVVKS